MASSVQKVMEALKKSDQWRQIKSLDYADKLQLMQAVDWEGDQGGHVVDADTSVESYVDAGFSLLEKVVQDRQFASKKNAFCRWRNQARLMAITQAGEVLEHCFEKRRLRHVFRRFDEISPVSRHEWRDVRTQMTSLRERLLRHEKIHEELTAGVEATQSGLSAQEQRVVAMEDHLMSEIPRVLAEQVSRAIGDAI